MKYWYESHLGGVFSSDEYLTHNDLYCETCHDYDFFLGVFSSEEEAIEYLQKEAY